MLVEGREDQVQTVGFSEILGSTDAFKDYQKFADVFFSPEMVALNFYHLLFTLFGVHGKMMLLGCRLFCFHCFQHLRYFLLKWSPSMCSYLPLGKLAVLVSLRNEKPWTGFVMSGTSLLTGTKTTIKDVLWDSRCLSTSNSLSHPCLSPSPARESFGFHLHPHVMADSALIKSVMFLEAKRKKGTMCGLTGVCVSSSMRV